MKTRNAWPEPPLNYVTKSSRKAQRHACYSFCNDGAHPSPVPRDRGFFQRESIVNTFSGLTLSAGSPSPEILQSRLSRLNLGLIGCLTKGSQLLLRRMRPDGASGKPPEFAIHTTPQ